MRRTFCTLIKFQMKFDDAKIVIIFQPSPLYWFIHSNICGKYFFMRNTFYKYQKFM